MANSIRTVNPFVHPFWCRVKVRVLSWFLVFESLLELGGVLKVWRWTCSSFPNSPGTFITPQFHRGFSPRSGWRIPARGLHPKGPVHEFHRSEQLALWVPQLCFGYVLGALGAAPPCSTKNVAAAGGMIQSQTQDLWQWDRNMYVDIHIYIYIAFLLINHCLCEMDRSLPCKCMMFTANTHMGRAVSCESFYILAVLSSVSDGY